MSAQSVTGPLMLSPAPHEARRQLEWFLARCRWNGDVEGLVLAVHEALSNAHRHGRGPVQARVWEEGSSIVVEVVDRGPGFDPGPHVAVAPQPWAERGRGLWLMGRFASDLGVRQQDSGVCLRLRFDPEPPTHQRRALAAQVNS
jgi:anti-sigma regulatory factor (Ser/Thr protein kinase)